MSQPAVGLAATALVMAISLAFIALFDFPTFAGWVAFLMLCLIPTQIVVAVLWGANPPFVARLEQPARGLALVGVIAVAAALIAPLVWQVVGEGISPPGPIPSHFAIVVVPTTFWLAIMLGGWPFTKAFRHPVAAGLALLVSAYVLTWVGFQLLFDYGFLRGAPVYLESAPGGLYHAVLALVFYVTALAVMFLVLCFDLWPFSTSPALMRQPVLGIVWTLTALGLGGAAMYVGVGIAGMDPMVFLTRVTVPFIFGTIVVLNMLGNTLFASMAQPLKGVANALAALVIGVALAQLYGSLAPALAGPLPSGAPGYEYEIWLANALLSVTFPLLIVHAAFFGFWPLAAAGPAAPAPERARAV